MPVPESETVVGELVALLVTVSAPASFLVPAGANFMVYCAVPSGARTYGLEVWAAMLKPAPEIDAPLIVTFWLPVLVMAAVSVLSWLTTTFPKARLADTAERVIVAELAVTY